MAIDLSKLSNEITEYIFSYLSPRDFNLSDNDYAKNITEKLPKFARIKFIESLHPFYRFLWVSSDFLKPYQQQIIQIASERGASEDMIFYLIKKGFQTSLYNFKYVCLNTHFSLIKYYLKKDKKLTLFLDNIVKHSRIDIIQWLLDNNFLTKFEKRKCMSIAFLKNDIVLLDYLHSLGFPLVNESSEFYYEFEFDFLKGKIKLETIDWCWKNGYKVTKEEALESNWADLIKYFSY